MLSKVRALVQCARNRCFGKPQDSISAAVVAQTPGRAVLSKLGIASASYDASCRALWVMLGCHLLAALIGLQLNGTWD